MEFGEISIKDKLGRTVILRNARLEDNMKYADGSYMDAYWMMKKI